jgi:hypothetical protein
MEDKMNYTIKDIQIKQKRGVNTPHSFIDIYTPASDENAEEARDNYKIGMTEHLGLKNTKFKSPISFNLKDFLKYKEKNLILILDIIDNNNPEYIFVSKFYIKNL